jgi:EAL domain-containing protein (putative c-di-GMP-specific phosphodiesterase class I)
MGPESTSQLFPTPERRRPSKSLDADPFASRLRLHNSRGRLDDPLSEVEADVVAALGLGQFHLLYQPRVALRSQEVVAIEALLRWRDASRGLLNPNAFLPTVAQTSAMAALGRWILGEATAEAARWEHERPAGSRPVIVSVNVEGREVLEPGFEDNVLAILEANQLPAAMVQLELDASDPLRSESLVSMRLQSLRARGVRIAIDGATPQLGAGSVTIEADSVHLQRRWVRGIGGDASLSGAVAELVERVHRSGGAVCALGVETRREAETLAAMGCDHAQGFLFCDPVESAALGWLGP